MSKPTYKKGKTLPKRDRYASSGLRIGAYIIDIVIVFIIANILIRFFFWRTDILYYFTLLLISYFLGFIYFFLFETFAKGQTLGKMICGLKTVNEEKLREASMKDHLINCLLKCHWLTCLIDFIIGIIYNYGEPEKRLRIMQNVSETVVIKKR